MINDFKTKLINFNQESTVKVFLKIQEQISAQYPCEEDNELSDQEQLKHEGDYNSTFFYT